MYYIWIKKCIFRKVCKDYACIYKNGFKNITISGIPIKKVTFSLRIYKNLTVLCNLQICDTQFALKYNILLNKKIAKLISLFNKNENIKN